MSPNASSTTPIRPLLGRSGAVTVPLWEQPQFVLAIAALFEANRLDPADCRVRLREAMSFAESERRACSIILFLERDGMIVDIVTTTMQTSAVVGDSIVSLGLMPEALEAPQRPRRIAGEAVSGVFSNPAPTGGDLLVMPLFLGCERIGVLIAEVPPGDEARPGWMQVFGDFLSWTLKGQREGGARAGLGLPGSASVVERDPTARWMTVALDLVDHPVAITDSPGVMNFVNEAAVRFITGVGVEDYATDLEPSAADDVDEITWRAQMMIVVAGAREGERPLLRRTLILSGDVVVHSIYDGRLVRHPITGSIHRQIMQSRLSPSGVADDRATSDRQATVPVRVVGAGLTTRQAEVALGLCRGERASEIASRLGVSVHTVRSHVRSLYTATEASRHDELIRALHDLDLEP